VDRETAAVLAAFIGRTAYLDVPATNPTVQDPLKFRVRVTDAKQSYGRLEVLIEPIDGQGQQWVTAKRLAFLDE